MSATDSPIIGWGVPSEDEALLPLNKSSIAYGLGFVVKTGPSLLYGFTVYSSRASSQFIQLYDGTAIPNSGAVPNFVIAIATVTDREMAWIPPRKFDAGIVIVNSTTGPTYTAGATDCFFDVQYL